MKIEKDWIIGVMKTDGKTSKRYMYMVSPHHVKVKDDVWVIDSGTSHHMTGNNTILQNYKKHDSKEHEITMADDNMLTSVGFGDVKLMNDNYSHISRSTACTGIVYEFVVCKLNCK
jgi:hypothetical protein